METVHEVNRRLKSELSMSRLQQSLFSRRCHLDETRKNSKNLLSTTSCSFINSSFSQRAATLTQLRVND